jgi:hypothetical protein
MAGHSRSKNGVASLAYVPAIHALFLLTHQDVDASKLGLARVSQVKIRRKSGKPDLR